MSLGRILLRGLPLLTRLPTRELTVHRFNRASSIRPALSPLRMLPQIMAKRSAHNMPLTYDFVRERIILILSLFDKIDPEKLTLDSHFIDDLGLDSLDHVEIIMMIEDDFYFEIPDKDMEHLMRPRDILRYITDKEEAYEELQKLSDHHHHDHDHVHEHANEHGVPHASASIHLGKDHVPIGSANTGLNASRREFSTLACMSKRYMSSSLDPPEGNYGTSFYKDKKKDANYDDILNRVLTVCGKYDKIDSGKLILSSHFVDDLGLDSLDHVEIMMELEDEFGLEIPDQDAEKLMRPAEVARYIFKKEEERSMKYEERPL